MNKLHSETEELKSKTLELQTQLAEHRKRSSQEISDLEDEITSLKALLAASENKCKQLESDADALKNRLAKAEAKCAQFEEDLANEKEMSKDQAYNQSDALEGVSDKFSKLELKCLESGLKLLKLSISHKQEMFKQVAVFVWRFNRDRYVMRSAFEKDIANFEKDMAKKDIKMMKLAGKTAKMEQKAINAEVKIKAIETVEAVKKQVMKKASLQLPVRNSSPSREKKAAHNFDYKNVVVAGDEKSAKDFVHEIESLRKRRAPSKRQESEVKNLSHLKQALIRRSIKDYDFFREGDRARSDKWSLIEFTNSLKGYAMMSTSDETKKMFMELDPDGTGRVSYMQFHDALAAKNIPKKMVRARSPSPTRQGPKHSLARSLSREIQRDDHMGSVVHV